MGYLFLAVALFAGSVKGYCGKRTSGYTNDFHDAAFANALRMLLCIVIGFAVVLINGDISQLAPSYKLIAISALSGVSTAVFVVTWLISVRKSAYMMLDVFLMLGVIIPLVFGSIFFDEYISPVQWIGIAILFAAVLLMCSYNNSIKEKITLPSFITLLICGAANGVTDFSQKLFVKSVDNASVAVFNFYTYVFTAVFLIITFFISKPKEKDIDKHSFKKISLFVIIMALCLFLNSYFKTLAAEHLSSILLYPLNQGMALVLSTLMSVVIFRERLTVKAFIGILTAFAGLLVINVL